MKFLLFMFLAMFLGEISASMNDAKRSTLLKHNKSSYSKSIIILDESRDEKVKKLFINLVEYYKYSKIEEYKTKVSSEKFIGDYSLFIEALEDDMRDYDISDISYTINSILPSGYKSSVARILNVTWQKDYDSPKSKFSQSATGISTFTFDEENGNYKLIKIAGDLLFGSSSGELRAEIGDDGEGSDEIADLKVLDIKAISSVDRIDVTIKNIGDKDIRKEFASAIELEDEDGNPAFFTIIFEDGIQSGETVSISTEDDSLENVNYVSAKVIVDSENEIKERNENNNELEKKISLARTNLYIHNAGYNSDTYFIDFDVKNTGTTVIHGFEYKIEYINQDDERVNVYKTYDNNMNPKDDINIKDEIPLDRGYYSGAIVYIDPNNKIDESDEDYDNVLSLEKVISLDIVPSDLEIEGGVDGKIKFTITNNGEGTIGWFHYVISYHDNYGNPYHIVWDTDEANKNRNPDPGESVDVVENVDFSSFDYISNIRISISAIDEGYPPTRENNEITLDKKEFVKADLEPTYVKAVGFDDAVCNSSNVIVKIKNNSDVRSISHVTARLHYSINGKNEEIWDLENISLGMGEEKEYTISNIDYCSASKLNLKLVVDEEELIPETNEDNNEKSSNYTRDKDLEPREISSSLGETSCDTQIVKVRIINNGTTSVSNATAKLFYTLNEDDELSKNIVNIDLDDGEEKEYSVDIGEYCNATQLDIKVVVDNDNILIESDEDNNELSETFEGIVEPDLSLSNLNRSEDGNDMAFTVSSASANSGANHYKINCSGSISDEVTGEIAAITKNGTLDIVHEDIGWLASCNEIIVTVDIENEVTESNEDNNIRTKEYEYVRPDLTASNIVKEDDTTITFDVRNINNIAGPNRYRVDCIDNSSLQEGDIPQLNANQSENITVLNINWLSTCYSIKVTVDSNEQVLEDDETNNEDIKDFPRPKPDLSLDNLACLDDTTFSFRAFNVNANALANHYKIECKDITGTPIADVTGVINALNKDDDISITHNDIGWLADCPSINVIVDVDEEIDEGDNEDNNIVIGFSCSTGKK